MKKELNNKGFSLVELIVVIAIMVVLVGVTSAVILNYMDHTKYGKDMTALDSLHTAIKLYVGDPDACAARISSFCIRSHGLYGVGR